MKTINKTSAFVICLASLCLFASGCGQAAPGSALHETHEPEQSSAYSEPVITGRFESREVRESSGVVGSPCQPGIFWTHNDSDDGPFVYAFELTGKHLGTWRVSGVSNVDWEDIAAFRDPDGNCFLFIGDTGNNYLRRSEFSIIRFSEPIVSAENSGLSKRSPGVTAAADRLQFEYPDFRQDAEAIFVHPVSADIYVITKRLTGAAGIYKLPMAFENSQRVVAEKVAELSVPAVPNGLITGADVSPNGRRVAVCDYFSAYELELPAGAENFDAIWSSDALRVDIGKRVLGEGITYTDYGNALVATSERRDSPIHKVVRTGSQ